MTNLKINTNPSYNENQKVLVKQLGEMMPEDKFTIFNNDAQQMAEAHSSPLKLNVGDKAPAIPAKQK